jgi:hypothetical protein
VNEPEVRRMLGYISAGYDNRQLSAATATVWTKEFGDVDYGTAKQAVRNHFRKPSLRDYLSLDVLLEQIRSTPGRSRWRSMRTCGRRKLAASSTRRGGRGRPELGQTSPRRRIPPPRVGC